MSEIKTYEWNGTSQAQRLPPALKAGYVGIEERSVADWVRFAQQFARELKFFNLNNEVEGDWSGFLKGDAEEMAAYLENPEAFGHLPEKARQFSRPHWLLFLVFLKLIKENHQPFLNQFTQRQLDHYYREVLQFQPNAARPDQVFLMAELARNFKGDRFLLKKGTAVFAGKDGTGKDRIYQTDMDLMVGRAQAVQLKNVFLHKSVKRLKDIGLPGHYMQFFQLALGEDGAGNLQPGGVLPATNIFGPNAPPDEAFFRNVLKLLKFQERQLRISPAGFRKLVRLKQQRDHDDNEWENINNFLKEMKSGSNATFTNSRNFVKNFMSVTIDTNNTDGIHLLNSPAFDELQNVHSVYELYQELELARINDPAWNTTLESFIEKHFYTGENIPVAEHISHFRQMMTLRTAIRQDWLQIRELLSSELQINRPLSLDVEQAPPDFDSLFKEAYNIKSLHTFFSNAHQSISSIDDFYNSLILLEDYFALAQEELYFVLKVCRLLIL